MVRIPSGQVFVAEVWLLLSLESWQHGARSESPGRHEKTGVTNHAVIRTHGKTLQVPGSEQGLKGFGFGKVAADLDRFGESRELGHGGNVSDD